MSLLDMLEPQANGLLNLGINLTQAGAAGRPLMGGIGQALAATQQNQTDQREYMRQQMMQKLAQTNIMAMNDKDLQTLFALDPSAAATVLAAKLRGSSRYGGETIPMNVKEWEYYSTLTPQQKEEYLAMKRAQQYLDQGSQFVKPDPLGTGAPPTPVVTKDLPPEKTPEHAANVASATKDAEAAAELRAKEPAYDAFTIAANDMMQTMPKVFSGGIYGIKGKVASFLNAEETQQFNNMTAQLSSQLRAVFRIPGEGQLSDKEQAQYGLTLPSLNNEASVNADVMRRLDQMVAARLRTTPHGFSPGVSRTPSAPGAGNPTMGRPAAGEAVGPASPSFPEGTTKMHSGYGVVVKVVNGQWVVQP